MNLTRLRNSVGDQRRCVEVFLHLHTNRGITTTRRERHSLHASGVGLPRVKPRTSKPAYWASWADCLSMVQRRHPHVAAALVTELEGSPTSPSRPRFGTVHPLSLMIQTPLAARRGQVRDQRKIERLWCWECPSATVYLCRSGWQTAITCAVSQSVPAVQDAQSAWLLFLMCAGPRAHHILRNLV